MSVEDWVKSLLASGYSDDTVRCRRYKLTHAAIGLNKSPVDVSTDDLVSWMAGHVEESYVGKHISRLLPDGYGAHSLRHRYATTTYAATHDPYLVARLLGHASVETTQIYVAMPDERLRAGMVAVRLAG